MHWKEEIFLFQNHIHMFIYYVWTPSNCVSEVPTQTIMHKKDRFFTKRSYLTAHIFLPRIFRASVFVSLERRDHFLSESYKYYFLLCLKAEEKRFKISNTYNFLCLILCRVTSSWSTAFPAQAPSIGATRGGMPT